MSESNELDYVIRPSEVRMDDVRKQQMIESILEVLKTKGYTTAFYDRSRIEFYNNNTHQRKMIDARVVRDAFPNDALDNEINEIAGSVVAKLKKRPTSGGKSKRKSAAYHRKRTAKSQYKKRRSSKKYNTRRNR